MTGYFARLAARAGLSAAPRAAPAAPRPPEQDFIQESATASPPAATPAVPAHAAPVRDPAPERLRLPETAPSAMRHGSVPGETQDRLAEPAAVPPPLPLATATAPLREPAQPQPQPPAASETADPPARGGPWPQPGPSLDLPDLLRAIADEPAAPAPPRAVRARTARPDAAPGAPDPAPPALAAASPGLRVTIGSIQLRVIPPPPAPIPAPRPAAPERPERFAPHRHYLRSG